MAEECAIKEVGPRDGLQNEKDVYFNRRQNSLINQLSTSGLKYIEITSFVHPKWIPALSDSVPWQKELSVYRVSRIRHSFQI